MFNPWVGKICWRRRRQPTPVFLPGNGNPLQYSCLGTPMDRGAWWATVRGATKTWTHLKPRRRHTCSQSRQWLAFYQTGTVSGRGPHSGLSAWPTATCGGRTAWSSPRPAAPGSWWRKTGPSSSARRGRATSGTTRAGWSPRVGTTPGQRAWR